MRLMIISMYNTCLSLVGPLFSQVLELILGIDASIRIKADGKTGRKFN